MEANFFQQCCKKTVKLVAKPTASLNDDLVPQSCFSQMDGTFESNIEILERHVQHMRELQSMQRLNI